MPLNKNVAAAIAHSAGNLQWNIVLIEAEPTQAGQPRKALLNHAQRQIAFLRIMIDELEAELRAAEAAGRERKEGTHPHERIPE